MKLCSARCEIWLPRKYLVNISESIRESVSYKAKVGGPIRDWRWEEPFLFLLINLLKHGDSTWLSGRYPM